ncbi:hypothetical protein CEXT_192201 [Caerostris extrusa]|uniref:Uncharacterized protein n=1 Tax=Caerostris extrusa TaxID=172846 RepID=A0AAV4UK24_CAEEX|nr:hypothetical protein CEXT_192201 [Caerostris extrusa]
MEWLLFYSFFTDRIGLDSKGPDRSNQIGTVTCKISGFLCQGHFFMLLHEEMSMKSLQWELVVNALAIGTEALF